MIDVDFMTVAERAIQQIKKGAFLTVKADERMNTMTIGWATIGFCWKETTVSKIQVQKTV